MNVYKMKGQAEGGPVKPEVKELRIDPRPAPPYRARVKMADKETQVTPERDSVRTYKFCKKCKLGCERSYRLIFLFAHFLIFLIITNVESRMVIVGFVD